MVATAPTPGLEQAAVLTGPQAARAMRQADASHAQMEAQRIEAIEQGIGQPVAPLDLGVAAEGVYRFRSSVRKTTINVRHPSELGNADKKVQARRDWELWASETFGSAWKSALKADEKLWDKGKRAFAFTEVPGRHESWFETNDPMVAAYIRSRLSEPELQHIWEEARPMFATLPDGTQIEVKPVDRAGQIAAANAQAAI
jgi:hypothetical protein